MKLDLRVLWLMPRPLDPSSRPPKAAIDRALEVFSAELRLVFPSDEISVSLVSTSHYVRGANDLKEAVDSCHLAVVDATGADADIAFALGLMAARDIPVILTSGAGGAGDQRMLSLANESILPLESIEQPSQEMIRMIVDAARQLRHVPAAPPADLRRIWFTTEPGDIYVVAAAEDHPTPYTSLTDRNYIYIDGLIDRDTLVGAYGFLHRLYPNSRIVFAASDIETVSRPNYIESDLVIVGGPGVPDEGIPGNALCRLMSAAAQTSVSYSDDGEQAYFAGETWSAQYTEDGIAKRDFGYLARFPNPFNPRCSVVMLHGLHTFGVLGAFRAISDNPRAYFNVLRVLSELGPAASFEAGFYVEVHAGAVVTPTEFVLRALNG